MPGVCIGSAKATTNTSSKPTLTTGSTGWGRAARTPKKPTRNSPSLQGGEDVNDLERLDTSMLRVLQRADATFVRKEGHNETAINAQGFEVDFLRRQPEGDDPHPFRFSSDEDDLWPVQAVRASVLTNAPRFNHAVISATGRMALMRTIAPESFVEFKRWMVAHVPQRQEAKRRRDLRQADIVQALLDDGLLMPQASKAP